ncbi:TonB-dependent receptor [Zeaxanthinibacter sp. PT1]|uniref:TonB-dependent receptor n=1 Tax=Zeaxanthinibacter TaxID=561554 RepID=UPI002349B77A|nr:TonB-dependent receptor [Zeaxanthinibacter sp. PT1]MDC6351039.1 TonB-dependent receptor [Zeaxanthinibacter sp. PT1]
MTLKRLILLVPLLFLSLGALAQTVIKGTVTDESGEPIPGANVVIVGKAIGTVTDFDGNYVLETQEEPPFTIRVTSIGYAEFTTQVTSSSESMDITLPEASTQLDEIVLSASRSPERVFESPVSVERFGLKEIKTTSSASFYDGLENLKGVDLNKNSLTFTSINTRGFATFANVRFLQLVDGMDNTAPGLNFVLGNLVGMSELEVQSVEILPGASSALYGAGAFNGILFMRSKNPFDYQGISAYGKAGLTSQDAAGDNTYYDIGIRAAHAFSDKLAVKANLSILKGEDWYATRTDDVGNPGFTRANPAYNGLNVYGDEVGTTLNFDQLAGLPDGTLGAQRVTRTGYEERDLVDYGAESVKSDFSVYYRPFANDFEIIYNGRVGRGNTIYQGANRFAVRNFNLQQHKLEFRNNNFFLRGYITSENAGDSYDTRFAAINLNRRWKSDQQWFQQYAQTYIGARLGLVPGGPYDENTAHQIARGQADTGRLVPGSDAFQNNLNSVIADGDLTQGAKFIDNTKFRHVDANYNFSHLMGEIAEFQVGGSYREYELNSQGTIFTDFDGPIIYHEQGAYAQVQKKLMDERLKFTGSVRFDKNEFFDGFFSPRLSVVYTAGDNRNQNFRFSVQQGFRNPTTQDLFIGLDAGQAILVGSAPDNLDRDVRTFPLTAGGQAFTGQESVQVVGRAAYENAFSVASVQAGAPVAIDTDLVQPEEVTAYEVGYRAQSGKFALDLSAYYNQYDNFISTQSVLVPLYGEAGDNTVSLLALQNGDFRAYQVYTNSLADIKSYGGSIGVDTKILGDFDLGASYTYADFEFDQSANPDFRPGFNTAKHKFKASFGHTELLQNFGFKVNYRWTDSYLWQSSFADGVIDAYGVLDAQINYSVPSIKSIFKAGGSNITGNEYFSATGSGAIGSIYYLSWTINP